MEFLARKMVNCGDSGNQGVGWRSPEELCWSTKYWNTRAQLKCSKTFRIGSNHSLNYVQDLGSLPATPA
jgi:hypothetical protein